MATPTIYAVKRFLPNCRVDVLLEDWVAPLYSGLEFVDEVKTTGGSFFYKIKTAKELSNSDYDLVINLHGGPTSAFFTAASRARFRAGFANYRFGSVYNLQLESPERFWGRDRLHSAEQQLALAGFLGVPVSDRPASRLAVLEASQNSAAAKLMQMAVSAGNESSEAYFKIAECIRGNDIARGNFCLMHPTAAFDTKTWKLENFAEVADFLLGKGLGVLAVASENESEVLERLKELSSNRIATAANLTLPEITAAASRAGVFIGNDSGIAHIAAAVNTPAVVIFGSSNRDNWRPWTQARNEIVFTEFDCQPCPGYSCEKFDKPLCILSVRGESVIEAVRRVLDIKA